MKFRSAAGHPAIRSNTRRCIWTACTRAYAIAWKSCAAMKFRPTSILCRARARCSRPCANAACASIWPAARRAPAPRLYPTSGPAQPSMPEEADLLDIARYFEGRVYGALDDYRSFSKKILIERLIAASEFEGPEFLGFGDGYVEIENIKEVGGVAVGVATAEPECRTVDEWKRQRLAGVGADFIIPNFLCRDELLAALFPNGQ